MKPIKITKACDLGQLLDELIAAVPALAPRDTGAEFAPGVPLREARVRLEGSASEVTVHLPDDVDEVAVRAAVKSHTPRQKVSPPDFRALMTEIEQAEAAFDQATTAGQIKAAQKRVFAAQRAFMKARAGL